MSWWNSAKTWMSGKLAAGTGGVGSAARGAASYAGTAASGAAFAVGSGTVAQVRKLSHPANILLILAILVNIFDSFPGLTFTGFDLGHFFGLVGSRGFWGIYDILHLNLFILIIFIGALALRGTKPNIILVTVGLFLALYVGSLTIKSAQILSLRNTTEIVLLVVAALLLFLKNYTREEYLATAVVIWLSYNIMMFGISQTVGGMIHFLFIAIFWLLTLGRSFDSDRSHALWWLALIIVIDFFLVGFFFTISTQLGSLPWLVIMTAVFAQMFQPTIFSAGMLIAIPIYLIFSMGLVGGTTFRGALGLDQTNPEDLTTRWDWLKPAKWGEWWQQSLNRSIYYGSGQDYYAGQVDANAQKDLGVHLDDFQGNERTWHTDEQIFLYAQLRAENAEGFDPTTISLRCSAWRGEEKRYDGVIQPEASFTVTVQDDRALQCVLPPMEKGTYQVRLEADFAFQTDAYLKRYFATRDRIDTLRLSGTINKNEDILRLNGITDTNPVAQNSEGPVRIEVGSRVPPLNVISRDEPYQQLFSSTLRNAWQGSIQQVSALRWYLPEGLRLDEGTCRFAMREGVPENQEKYGDHRLYELSVIDNPRLKDTTEVVQSCVISADPSQLAFLLSDAEVTTRYFWLEATYSYLLRETLSLTVREDAP